MSGSPAGWMSGPGLRRAGLLTRAMHAEISARSLFAFLFPINIFVLLLLPSGSLGGVNFKILAFLAILPFAWWISVTQSESVRELLFPIAVVGGLAMWTILGAAYGTDIVLGLQQMKDLLATIASTWMILLYCRLDAENPVRFLRLVVWITIAISAAKAIVFVYLIAEGIPIYAFVDMISRIFNVELVTAGFEDSVLGRFELLSDSAVPLCVFSILTLRRRLRMNLVVALFATLILAFSLLVSFSRYLWIYFLIAVVLGMWNGKGERLRWYLAGAGALVVAMNFQTIAAIVALRFSEKVAGASDVPRIAQGIALHDFFLDAPFFGHGLGSYTTAVIRSTTVHYAYENQLAALLGQVGILGCLLLLVLTVVFYRHLFFSAAQPLFWRLTIVAIFAVWIAGGFLNPQLLSSVASISYGAILALSLVALDNSRGGRTGSHA